jgi:hypothetical protein
MRHIFLLTVIGIMVGAALADGKKENKPVDPTDLIIEKSKQTMQSASRVSALADQVVVSEVSQMKETIVALEIEKEQLFEQVKVMEDEIVTIKSASVQPFNVLAIGVPDTASGK